MRPVGFLSLVLAAMLALPCLGQAADISWRNAVSGLFQNAARWQPQQIPGAADRAIFAQPVSYTVSFNASPTNLQSVVNQGSVVWSLTGNSYTLSGQPALPFALGLDVSGAGVPASLRIRNGLVSSYGARIDGVNGGSGSAIIEIGATLAVNSESLVVGDFGSGDVQVLAGGLLSSDFATLAFEETATATLTVSGSNARWFNDIGVTTHPLRVGSSGDALLSVASGGRVETGQLIVADLVTSTSVVTLSGGNSTIEVADCAFVGYEGNGQLQVSSGGVLTSLCGELGSMPGAQGAVTVSGAGSLWNAGSTLNVGLQGQGTLSIEDGGRLTSGLSILGQEASGAGLATLTGQGSRWDLSQQLQVGQDGEGTLNVLGGAVLTSLKAASGSGSSGILGAYDVGHGTATVAGANSLWSGDGVLQIGFNGHALLTVADGGRVAHEAIALGRNSGSQGEATLIGPGATLAAATFLSIGGSSAASGGIGRLTVGSGASAQANSQVTIWTAGELTLSGGMVQSPLVHVAQGRLLGAGTVSADLINDGLVCADVPGLPLAVTADYMQSSQATLEIVVGPEGAGQLDVAGNAHWDGALRVTPSAGFEPDAGSVFSAATFGSGSGSFDSVLTVFGPEAQDFFALLVMPGGLSLYAPFVGDANLDGMVSGGDFTIWADNFGLPGGWTDGDFNGDGLVSGGDYTLWADNFGAMTDLAAPRGAAAVPEPMAGELGLASALTAAVLAAARRSIPRRLPRPTGRAPARRRRATARRSPA